MTVKFRLSHYVLHDSVLDNNQGPEGSGGNEVKSVQKFGHILDTWFQSLPNVSKLLDIFWTLSDKSRPSVKKMLWTLHN